MLSTLVLLLDDCILSYLRRLSFLLTENNILLTLPTQLQLLDLLLQFLVLFVVVRADYVVALSDNSPVERVEGQLLEQIVTAL